jgi:hypothetical protein
MEKRTTRTKNGTRTHYVRVDTHRAEDDFSFTKWTDESPPASSLDFLNVLHMVRIQIKKKIKYSSYAKKSYEKQKKEFIRHNHTDRSYDYELTEIIPFAKKFSLIYNEEKGDKAWYSNTCLLAVLDLFLLGWIVRMCFNANTRYVKYKIKKKIDY